MKQNRIIWLSLWIISFVGINFYGGVISYGLFSVLTIIPIVSLIYVLYVYFTFHIYQELGTRNLVVNQPIPYFFTLVNEFPLSYVGIKVDFFSSFSSINGLENEEYELVYKKKIKQNTTLICKYRGEYEVGIKTVEIQDYFRLFNIKFHNKETLRVIVKPEIIHIDEFKNFDIISFQKEVGTSVGRLDVLAREYTLGDDIRNIHWGLTAKTGHLMSREHIGDKNSNIGIIIGNDRVSSNPSVYLPIENKMLETTLAISLYLLKKNISIFEIHKSNNISVNRADNIGDFNKLSEIISRIQFDEIQNAAKIYFSELEKNYDILNCNHLFLVLSSLTTREIEFVSHIKNNNSNMSITIFLIDEDGKTYEDKALDFRIVKISPEDDLKEVL